MQERIYGLVGVMLGIAGYAMPIAFPKVDPWVGDVLLILAGLVGLHALHLLAVHRGWMPTLRWTGPRTLGAAMSGDRPKNVFHIGDHNRVANVHVGDVNIHGRQPRVLGPNNRKDILDSVPRSLPVKVSCSLGDGEAAELADQFYEFLKANGYAFTFDGIHHDLFVPGVRGVRVVRGPEFTEIMVGTNN